MAGFGSTLKTHLVVPCKYHGFIHADVEDPSARPGIHDVERAVKMLSKRNIKKTRKLHPLFGRGFDTKLEMRVTNMALRVLLPAGSSKDKKESIVMNTQLHKLAFVAQVDDSIGVIIKRPGLGKFKCHLFVFDNAQLAHDTCVTLQQVTSEAFRLLRKVSKRMRKKEVKDGPPDLPKRKDAVADEEQQWFHGPMSRERAEAILQGFAACDGLFLVRASERTPSDVVISFYIGGHVFHNKLHKVADGYQNSNGNTFPNLRTIVLLYQGKHPDMQTVLTEYVPRERAEQGGVEYANASVMRDNKPSPITTNVRTAMRWNTVDIQAALAEADAADEDEDAGDYDPIYDDVRFGFGNEFVSFVFGAAACEEPTPESSLDNDVFNLAERLDIRDDA